MKAYLIDPVARTVTDIEVDETNDHAMLMSLYAHMQCVTLEAVNPLNAGHDVIYLDENGKFHPTGSFFCRLWPHDLLTGRAIWIGCDGKGGNCAPEMSRDYVAAHIVWADEAPHAPGGFKFVLLKDKPEAPPDITPLAPGIFILHGKPKNEDGE